MMNFRNRYLVITLRTLLGLLFLLSGVGGLVSGGSTEGVPSSMVPAVQQFWSTGILQLIKGTEAVAGFMLLIGFLPALAALFVAPICVGIIVFHLRIAPSSIPLGIVVTLLTAYVGYAYWDKYKALFRRP